MAKYKKRPDGRYATSTIVGYTDDGKPKRKTLYGRTIMELDKKVALLDASIRSAHKRMDSAGIGRADLIEHIEHEKIERNEHHGE